MTDRKHKENAAPRVCSGCGGSGQLSFFRGVSRFVMDWEDCPECNGTGILTEPPVSPEDEQVKPTDTVAPEHQPPAVVDDHD